MDLRVIKTRQNIIQTFLRLLETHKFEAITIKLLTTECQINKSTFYRNFEDKFDLSQQIMDDTLHAYRRAVETLPFELNADRNGFDALVTYFSDHADTLDILLKHHFASQVFSDMAMILQERLFDIFRSYVDDSNSTQNKVLSLYAGLIANNLLTTIKWWHTENPSLSSDFLVNLMNETLDQGILPELRQKLIAFD
ncbi:TetR/AcrR family transcriptional regulator [Secundilactobacillus similis DSM 23365 = JCM 2765]|nr:TetR/AcrR family transcriptional regulator [Secundilactobacillus similis]